MRSRRRHPALLAVATNVVVLAALVADVLLARPAQAQGRPWPGHPDRALVTHVVRPGDTATGLATRYHAWARELIALNHLGPSAALHVGEKLRIPVVLSALPRQRPSVAGTAPQQPGAAISAPTDRAAVGRAIAREARAAGVPVHLAQAVGWQESGWRQPVRSSAGAVGVMQVLPATGLWMSLYAGRPLDVGDTRDNITAGVTLLRVLLAETRSTRKAVGAYYQGLGAVHRHGLYDETKAYVASVLAIRDRLVSQSRR